MLLLLFATLGLQALLPAQSSAPAQPFYGPAFQLSATPTRPLLEQGGSTAVTLTVVSAAPTDFKLSFAGIPSSVTASTSTARSGAQTIVFRCSPQTPPGVYALQITAAAGQNQQTLTFAFVVHPKGDLGPG
jgi:hypothetical protein